MSQLIVIANITAKPDQVDLVKSALLKLIKPTRQENGCIQYDLHQDNEQSSVFVFYERWESRALLQAHMASEHIKTYIAESDGAIASFTINEMSHI